MLLTVMALVHNRTGTLPREAARLYASCVNLLMFEWKPFAATWLMNQLKLREDDLYRALWELAYEAHSKQAGEGGPANISEAAVVGLLRRQWGSTQKAEQFCQYIEQRAGLLVGRGHGENGWRVFTFPHRTFQEYLAGCFIANSRRDVQRLFAEKAREGAHWREALLLAAGHLVLNENDIATPIDIAKFLVEPAPHSDDDWRAVWLAGDIVLLVGLDRVAADEYGDKTLPLLRKRLASLVGGGNLPQSRASHCRTNIRMDWRSSARRRTARGWFAGY